MGGCHLSRHLHFLEEQFRGEIIRGIRKCVTKPNV